MGWYINRVTKGIVLVLAMFLFACADENGDAVSVIEENSQSGNENETPAMGSNTTMIITWQDNSDNEEGFTVERKVQNETEFDVVATLTNNSTQYNDQIKVADKVYCYRISAFNQAGVGESDEQCEFVPSLI